MPDSGSFCPPLNLTTAIHRDYFRVSPNLPLRAAIAGMNIGTFPSAPPAEANEPIHQPPHKQPSCVLVMEAEQVVGILTEQDMLRLLLQQPSVENLPIQSVMTHPVMTLPESAFADPQRVLHWVQQHPTYYFPVLDPQDQVVGVTTAKWCWQALNPLDLYQSNAALAAQVKQLESEPPHLRPQPTPNLDKPKPPRMTRPSSALEVIERMTHMAGSAIHRKRSQKGGSQETNFRWQFALESSGDGLWDWNLETNTMFFSRQWQVLLGVGDGEIENTLEAWDSRIHPDDKAQCYADLNQHLRGESSTYENEHRIRCQDGTYRWVLDRGKVVAWAADGTPLRMIGTFSDISDRKAVELTLRKSEAALLETQRIAHIGSWEMELDRQTVSWSPELFRICGLDPTHSTLTYAEILQLLHPEDRPQLEACVDRAIADGTPYQLDYRVILPDGSLRYHEARGMVVRDEQGQITRLFGSALDITARKLAQQQLQNLIESTSAVIGEDFFPALVSHIAQALNVSYAIISEQVGEELRVLAFWADGVLKSPFSFALANTPCEQVLQDGFFYCEDLVQERFPKHLDLAAMSVRSYLGIALQGAQGQPIGNLCILGRQPIQEPKKAENLLRIFAARVSAELERQRAIEALEQLNQALEQKVEERTAALQASEQLLRSIYEGVSQPIFVVDVLPDHRLRQVGWNPATAKLMGRANEEVVNRPIQEALAGIFDEPTMTAIMGRFQQCIATREPLSVEESLRHQGQTTWTVTTYHPLIDSTGRVYRVVGSVYDITDRKTAELALQERELQFRLLTENIPGMTYRYTVYPEGRDQFTYISPRIREIYELEPEAVLQDSGALWAAICSEDMPFIKRACASAIQEQRSFCVEHRITTPGGQLKWLQTIASPRPQDNGNIISDGVVFDITDRKLAEAELAKSRQQYYSLIQSVNGIVWEYDLRTEQFIFVSDKAEALLGYPIEDWLSQPHFWKNHIYSEDSDAVLSDFQRIYEQKSWEQEYRMVAADGRLVWVYDISTLNLDAAGHPSTSSGVLIDIGDRKQAEEKLRQQATQKQLLWSITQTIRRSLELETVLNATVQEIQQRLKVDRVVVYRFQSDWSGIFIAEAVDEPWIKLVAPDQPQIWEDSYLQDLIWEDSYRQDCQWSRFRNQETMTVSDIYTAGFQPCYVEFLEKLQARAYAITPILVGESLWGLLGVYQNSAPYNWPAWEVELLQQIANQLTIAIQQANLFEQVQQELAERQQTQQQLTERNAQLAITNEELARATRLKDEFLANMSHELRTPLNAILGMTEALHDRVMGDVNQRQIKALQTIEKSGTHLLALINDILDLSKIESGQIELSYAPTSIEPLCQSSLTFIKQLAFKKQIQLNLQLPSHLPTLWIDELRIRQVLINLLNNAVKFTPEGGQVTLTASYTRTVATEVDSAIDAEGDSSVLNQLSLELQPQEPIPPLFLTISVTDTGIGIAPEHQDKLFKPFIQIDSALNRQYTGTGLGLALVKRIVELHGGQVSLTSQLGIGSCFTIKLPYQEHAPAGLEPKNPAPAVQSDPLPQREAPLILLVEDNPDNVLMLSSYLEIKGYRIVLAQNGQEALDRVESQTPDVILMDIQMPGMDGFEAIQHIRSIPRLVDVPILALTALAMPDDRDRCLAAGANEYLTKPFRLHQLERIIQGFLAHQGAP